MRPGRALAVLALAALGPAPGRAAEDGAPGEPPAAQQLLERAFHNLYADDYVQTLAFETSARGAAAA